MPAQDTYNNDNIEIQTACENGNWEKFQILVNSGADINFVDRNRNTCLHLASQGIFFFSFLYNNKLFLQFYFGTKN